eukprot:485319-Prorocentrum_minimum.AAC.9
MENKPPVCPFVGGELGQPADCKKVLLPPSGPPRLIRNVSFGTTGVPNVGMFRTAAIPSPHLDFLFAEYLPNWNLRIGQ